MEGTKNYSFLVNLTLGRFVWVQYLISQYHTVLAEARGPLLNDIFLGKPHSDFSMKMFLSPTLGTVVAIRQNNFVQNAKN